MCPPQLLSTRTLIRPDRLESTTTGRRASLVQCRYLIDKETSTLIPTRSAFEADDNVRPQMEKSWVLGRINGRQGRS
jgi:hypothetical protein